MSSYILKTKYINNSDEIKISEGEYSKLQHAQSLLETAAQIEEKLDLLLENYLDYEQEILNLGLKSLIRNPAAEDLEAGRPNLNRKLVNVLTAAKLYIDQSMHDLSHHYGKKSQLYNDWNQYRNDLHGSHFSYQFMEILRNSVQHHSLPIHSVSYQTDIDRDQTPAQSKKTVSAKSRVETLLEFKDFKRDKNSELVSQMNTRSDSKGYILLEYHIRQYVDCLSLIHKRFRELTYAGVQESETVFKEAKTKASGVFSEALLGGLIGFHLDSDSNIVSSCSVNTRRMERRRLLAEKNINLGNLCTSYIYSMHLEGDV